MIVNSICKTFTARAQFKANLGEKNITKWELTQREMKKKGEL